MKLTNDQVEDIRRRCARGESQLALAKELGVNPSTVSDIVLWKTRKVPR